MAFATVTELSTYLRRGFDTDDSAVAALTLDISTQMIRSYTEQWIERVTETVTLQPNHSTALLLPQIPVTAVSAVTYDETTMTTTDYSWSSAGIITKAVNYWDEIVTVTYTHGYDPVPADIRGVCLDVAKRAMENPAGLQRDDLNTASQWLGFTRENRAILDRYKG